MSFLRAIRSEFAKILSTRLWWVLAIILCVYVAFTAAAFALIFGGLADQLAGSGAPVPVSDDVHLLVYSSASSIGYVFPVLFGALAMTAEFRHQTLTPTFLASPRRGQVLVAKLVVLAVFGAIFGLIALVGAMSAGGTVLGLTDGDPAFGASSTWTLVARVLLAMALWSVIGVALGSLVPSQVASIVIVLAFTQFLEPILRIAPSVWEWTGDVVKFLPGAASDALVGSSLYTAIGGMSGGTPTLEWWQGGLVLLLIAVLASFAGFLTTWRKDVT